MSAVDGEVDALVEERAELRRAAAARRASRLTKTRPRHSSTRTGVEAEVGGIEVGGVAEVARREQRAVEVVRPPVVLADEVGALPGVVAHERSGAVAAHVVERRGSAPSATDDHEDAPAGDVVRDVVAGSAELGAEPGELPLAGEDRVPLPLVDRRVVVRGRRERGRVPELVGVEGHDGRS